MRKFVVYVVLASLLGCAERQPSCEVELESLVLQTSKFSSGHDIASGSDREQLIASRTAVSSKIADELRSCPSALSDGIYVRGVEGGSQWLAIDIAALTEDYQLMRELLARPVDWIAKSQERVDFLPRSALHLAAWNSNREVLRLLVEYGFDVNSVDEIGDPVLAWAVDNRASGQIVAELLRLGADPKGPMSARMTPLEATIFAGAPGLASMLLDAGALNGLDLDSISRLIRLANERGVPEIAHMVQEVSKID